MEEIKMKKLIKNNGVEKKLTGVCGVIGKYFKIDATIIRLAFALSFFCYGFGLGIYLLLALAMPKEAAKNPINA